MKKELHKLKLMDYNYGALTIFDRIGFAVNTGRSKPSPFSMGTVPKQAKTFFPRIPLESTIKQCPDYKGFFVRAVLQTILRPQVGRVELTDERNHSSASRGRSIISQDMQDVGVKGLNHSATVSSARAVADADFI